MTVAAVLFLSPTWMAVAAGLLCLTLATAAVRRVGLDRTASLLCAVGGGCWALSAGTPVWDRSAARGVAVMVDLSPSTRGAAYRDRVALDRRVAQLVGPTPHQLFAFAGGDPRPLPPGPALPDLPCDRTVFAPPPSSDAVLLFSDGRFVPPPVAPPTFAVTDPSLEHPADAAVQRLAWSGDRVTAVVVAATGPRSLRWTGADPPTADATNGGVVSARATADDVTAAMAGGDLWPENDRLAIRRPPPPTAERWWVGRSPPPPGWRAIDLPTDPAAYLSAGVIALDDVPADALSTEQHRRLSQFVRDLGGGLVVGGGPSAFAAGAYGSTPLDALAPLASDPPTPAGRWVVLIDGSGSMAVADGDRPAPWRVECDAVARLLPVLPPADAARVGSFAAGVTWWATDGPAAAAPLVPPAGVVPGGPTNLAAALRQASAAAAPTHVLLMTDADANLPDPAALSAALVAHHVTLHVLATGDGSALPALRSMAAATGGSLVRQADPAGWVSAATSLARGAVPRQFVDQPTVVHWVDGTGPAAAAAWNRTWLKPEADALATGPDAPLAARWRAGAGRVAAVAFAAAPDVLDRLANGVAAEPADPRFTLTWDAAADVRLSVDAVDGNRYLNGLAIALQLDDGRPSVAVGQVGPGTYAASVPPPGRPTLATVRAAGRVIGRRALAGRYPPEFDAVGTDRPALADLAGRSGGAVVEPADIGPIRFPGPHRRTPLSPELATAGAAAVAAALVRWRRRGT